MTQRLRKKSEEAADIANGDLLIPIEVVSESDKLGQSFSSMTASLRNFVNEVHSSISQMSTEVGELTAASQTLASGAHEQAASLEEVSSTVTDWVSEFAASVAFLTITPSQIAVIAYVFLCTSIPM